ncbi:NADH-quinone oxidoreductase subunit M [Salinispora arenicola]|uniref:NADH dehydrogenase subunit M n=2 Tax=Salinispora arenicola TaxID=168697 RepID=A0A542XLV4_SALAC|nr:NADH-quinone oxidoreductase subunit M [Salinispora arenicola]MCN0152869.1 NADH-quinone oxidoreductase subunit M [Salinispora arenicola]MCN0178518.1 NADH-quinone oxidoreductase subunit M [Salinispora arenicola]NIL41535.1 NADH-quinone oxidoreductase subunit M [Salinispora arenicola]NIL57821.1 NADH-quinone oxidoreductase subunit M [Salinispora arenicola]NIL63211.1 NADH-quinone oxidoreductase subunit M [Salinispora arenicola]
MSDFPFLSVLTVAPLVGALVVAVLPRRRPELAKQVALGWSLLVLALSVVMWVTWQTGGERFQFRESYPWIPNWGVNFTFAADGIALVMLMLIAVLVPLVILASWHDAESSKRSVPVYFALLLVLECTMIGVFAAADVFLFYVFFEVMLVPMYFLIGSYGGHQRQYAAVKFFLYSLVGGLFMLAAVIGLWVVGGKTFDWVALSQVDISTGAERWLFLGFFVAFAIKAPFFPFHTWLPDAGGAAPAGAAALLVGVLDKVGTFGILRYCLPLFPDAAKWFAPWALALGLIGIIYAALLAVGQNDLKRLVSYTSIAHFGFIGVGIFAFTSQAATGAVLYMVNHGLATGLLFLVVGMLVARRGSALISDFGGAGKLVPLLAGVLFFAGLASLALPGTAPFISEFLVLIGTFSVNKPVAVIATLGIILAAAYVLWMVQRTTQGTLNPALTEVDGMKRDLNLREKVVVAPLVALIVLLGFYPKPVTDVINPAVQATMQDIGKTDPAPSAGTTQEASR